jgi:hypothetical protein
MAISDTSRYLFEAILDQGTRNANFFNGRILTADALQTEQDANRRRGERLGQALGTGIITGLEVELVDPGAADRYPVVSVSQGLALNPKGQLLALPVDITKLQLTRQLTPTALPAGLFAECKPPKTDAAPPTDRGIYLLVAAPTSCYEERAPKYDFSDTGKASGCDSRYATEGVQFRLAELKLDDLAGLSQDTRQALAALLAKDDTASLSKLRNWLAHVCFGTEELTDFQKDPLATVDHHSRYLSYGAVDAMRAANRLDPDKGVSECEAPLVLLFWTKTGVQFLDMWAVRRRAAPPPCSRDWPLLEDERSLAEAEARFFQFQTQIGQLLEKSTFPASIKAHDYFRYLPSAGLLTLAGPGPKGVSATTFFQDLAVRYPRPPRFDSKDGPVFMEGARLKALLRDALSYPAIDASGKEAVWLYRLRENRAAIAAEAGLRQTVIAFAHGQMPYYGSPRFDAAYFDYGNYSSVLLGPGGR